jgi:hypothetical protein
MYEQGVNDEVVVVVDRLLKNIFDEGRLDPKRYQDTNIFLENVDIRVYYGDITLKWTPSEKSYISINMDERNNMDSVDFNLNGQKGGIHLMRYDRSQTLMLIMQFIEGHIPHPDYSRMTS